MIKNKLLKILCLSLASLLIFSFSGCGEKSENTDLGSEEMSDSLPENIDSFPKAIIYVENYGEIKVALDKSQAPITVENFITLAKSGFYDGLTFHRIVEDFVIQGGDPRADGTGGSKDTIKGEFIANGVSNTISHKRGVISMARLGNDYNSATSQFFIVLSDDYTSSLDTLYAAFGYVTEGMDIVDKIVKDAIVADYQSGFVLKQNQPKISKIEISE